MANQAEVVSKNLAAVPGRYRVVNTIHCRTNASAGITDDRPLGNVDFHRYDSIRGAEWARRDGVGTHGWNDAHDGNSSKSNERHRPNRHRAPALVEAGSVGEMMNSVDT